MTNLRKVEIDSTEEWFDRWAQFSLGCKQSSVMLPKSFGQSLAEVCHDLRRGNIRQHLADGCPGPLDVLALRSDGYRSGLHDPEGGAIEAPLDVLRRSKMAFHLKHEPAEFLQLFFS